MRDLNEAAEKLRGFAARYDEHEWVITVDGLAWGVGDTFEDALLASAARIATRAEASKESTTTPGSEATNKPNTPPTPKVEDSVVEAGGE